MSQLNLLKNYSEALSYQSLTFNYYHQLLEKIGQDNSIISLGIDLKNEAAGLILATYNEAEKEGWIQSIFIKPEFRRQGLGTTLLSKLETILKERNCLKVNLNYTENLTSDILKHFLIQHNWQQPENSAILFYFTRERVLASPHPHLIDRVEEFKGKLSSEYEIFPWLELTADEEKAIKKRQKTDQLWQKYNPFFSDKIFQPCGSYGVRYRGQVVAWTISNSMQPELLTVAQMFVSQDQPLRGRILLAMMSQALKEIFDSPWENYAHRVDASNHIMLKFVNSWLASYIENQRRTWTTHKLLNS